MNIDFYNNIPMVTEGGYHTLIAGCTGSGKSTLLHGIILHILTLPGTGLYLIDPKRVELSRYKNSTHCISYGNNKQTIEQTLRDAVKEMERRFDDMERKEQEETSEPARYLIIDELAQFSKDVNPELAPLSKYISQIASLGRAARIFMIGCTQRPTNDIITPMIKSNCDCKIALRCSTEQESRNILGISDAATLPLHGQCIMRHPAEKDPIIWPVRKYPKDLIKYVIDTSGYWRTTA